MRGEREEWVSVPERGSGRRRRSRGQPQTPSPHAAQPHSLAKCWAQTLAAVAILLHPFHLRQPGVISWTPNYDAAALLPSDVSHVPFLGHLDVALTSNMRFCERATLNSHVHSAWTRLVRRWKWLAKSPCASAQKVNVVPYRHSLHTDKGECAQRACTSENQFWSHRFSTLHIKTGQLLSAQSVCEWVFTLAPTGLISVKKKRKKKVALIVCVCTHMRHTHTPACMAASTRLT